MAIHVPALTLGSPNSDASVADVLACPANDARQALF